LNVLLDSRNSLELHKQYMSYLQMLEELGTYTQSCLYGGALPLVHHAFNIIIMFMYEQL